MVPTRSDTPATPPPRSLAARLGWQHVGFRATSRGRALISLALLLLLPCLADQFAFQARMRDHNPDLLGWLANARDIQTSSPQTFYRDNPFYIYPPFFLTLIAPLTHLPTPAAAAVFETSKWIALLLSLWLAWRLCSPTDEDVPPIVALGSLICTWRFFDNDLGMGNINILLLAVILAGIYLAGRRQHLLAGALIAVAASIKVTPALILVYFLYKRWWKTLPGALIGLAICLIIWPALWFGWENNWHLLASWYHAVVAGFIEHGAVRSEHTNQALVGIINRLFGPHVGILSGRGEDVYLTIINLPPFARDLLRLLLAGGIVGGLAWTCRHAVRPRENPLGYAAEISLVLIAMLLLSGLSWKAHFVTMTLPYSVLLAYLADRRYSPGPSRTVGVLLLASFALGTLTSDIITPRGADWAEALGLIALGAIAAAAGLWRIRQALRP